ncbi:MAG TPA: methylated-DNA--[protein]-cysteine S-methyltransferase [Steroidobacteraceae bacterium]|jgi:AraC family transcriptional regulator of adaptative response/methylated-DNA-[protein]-cysteine methyltransferase
MKPSLAPKHKPFRLPDEKLSLLPNDSVTIRYAITRCSMGPLLVAATGSGVCALLFGEDPQAMTRDLQRRFSAATLLRVDLSRAGKLGTLIGRAVALVETPAANGDLALDVCSGTPFQRRVWRALQAIPAGVTLSYTDVARRIGEPRAIRAVAQACGANPIAVAIPCHRVVRSDGALSGYRWGTDRKRTLLQREAAI